MYFCSTSTTLGLLYFCSTTWLPLFLFYAILFGGMTGIHQCLCMFGKRSRKHYIILHVAWSHFKFYGRIKFYDQIFVLRNFNTLQYTEIVLLMTYGSKGITRIPIWHAKQLYFDFLGCMLFVLRITWHAMLSAGNIVPQKQRYRICIGHTCP